MKLPDVVGLILCERMEVETSPLSVNLMGLFHMLRFNTFPSPPQQFTAYSGLYGGVGEGTIQLRCMRLENERDIHRYQRWIKFPERQTMIHLYLPITQCVFPAPGRYSFTLSLDEHELSVRFIDVYHE